MDPAQRSYEMSRKLTNAIGVLRPQFSGGGLDSEVIESLLRLGADVNVPYGSFVPLHSACMMARFDIVSILLRWGADVNQLDGFHRGALHHAVEKSIECTKLLLQAGANTEILDLNSNTPLHWAAFRNEAECCGLLLGCGANVNAQDINNDTPLNWAAMRGSLDSTRVLLEYNAQPDIISHAKMLPITRVALLLAAGSGGETCFEYIMKAMGNIEMRISREDRPGVLQLRNLMARDVEVAAKLNYVCSNARSLQSLTRFVIRKALGSTYLPSAVAALPVPRTLKDFILLKY